MEELRPGRRKGDGKGKRETEREKDLSNFAVAPLEIPAWDAARRCNEEKRDARMKRKKEERGEGVECFSEYHRPRLRQL